MKRVLLCAVAVELLAGLILGVVATGTPRAPSLNGRGDAAVARRVHVDALLTDSSYGPHSSMGAGSPHGFAPSHHDGRAHGRGDGQRDDGMSGSAAGISFAMPRDFATGATPSAAAFNRTSGDQIVLHLAHTNVSDGVALGDFNGDGALDAVQTNVLTGTVSLFRGDGRGRFSDPTNTPVGVNPSFVLARDLDGDGILDLAVTDAGTNSVLILRGDGRGRFGVPQVVPVPSPRDIALGDVDADGVPDLAVSSSAGAAVLTGTRSANGVTFTRSQFLTVPRSVPPTLANSVALGNFDGRGGDDLALGVGTSPSAGYKQSGTDELVGDDVLIFLNQNTPGANAFADTPTQRVRVGAEPAAFAVADFNGDSHNDLVVLDGGSGDLATLLGDGSGHFTLKARNTTVGCLPRTLKVADVNNDEILDVVTVQFCASTAAVLLGRGDGTFDPAVDFWTGNSPTAIDVGLVDGDARPDLVVARLRDDLLSFLRNESGGTLDGDVADDGVTITRDIAYVNNDTDLMASQRTLDVYTPPAGTASLVGASQSYPVLLFAHGGAGIAGDKTMVTLVMRSIARQGVVAVSTNYRLLKAVGIEDETHDVADAFDWTRSHIAGFGGDPDRIVVGGASVGGWAAMRLATETSYADKQRHIRGLAVLGPTPDARDNVPPHSLLIDGTDGVELALATGSAVFAKQAFVRNADSTAIVVPDRDHFSVVATLALPNDPGRVALLQFLQRVMR